MISSVMFMRLLIGLMGLIAITIPISPMSPISPIQPYFTSNVGTSLKSSLPPVRLMMYTARPE
jgi:hypothetical protein